MSEKIQPEKKIGQRLAIGAVYMVIMRWSMRLMGLASTVILARLLTPADFGLVAIATVFQGLLEVIINLNVELALFRNQKASREHYDSAWTISILQFTLLAIILFLSSGLVATFYGDDRLTAILQVLSLSMFVFGFINIGVIDFRRDLEFSKDLKFNLWVNACRVISTIVFAFLLKSYWAIVMGMIAGTVSRFVLSYAMSSYRPNLCLKRVKEIWNISAAVWLINITKYLDFSADRLIIGRMAGANILGGYSLAVDLARMPSAELVMPISRALIPGYAKVKDNITELRELFIKSLQVVAVLALPIAFGLPIVTPDIVPVLLGDKWLFIVPFMQISAVLAVIEFSAAPARPMILAAGDIKPLVYISVIASGVGIVSIYPAYQWEGVMSVLWVLITIRFLFLFSLLYLSSITLQCHYKCLLRPFFAPLLSSLLMFFVLTLVDVSGFTNIGRLLTEIALGGVVYTLALPFFWLLLGKQEGIEKIVLDKIRYILVSK